MKNRSRSRSRPKRKFKNKKGEGKSVPNTEFVIMKRSVIDHLPLTNLKPMKKINKRKKVVKAKS